MLEVVSVTADIPEKVAETVGVREDLTERTGLRIRGPNHGG
jgi:hypothetical protein